MSAPMEPVVGVAQPGLRETRRDALRSALRSATRGRGAAVGPDSLVEVWFRLPFQVALDEALHHFPLEAEWAGGPDTLAWAARGGPWAQVSVHNVAAPWRQVVRPGFVVGLRLATGDASVGAGAGEMPPDADAYDTWVRVVSPGCPLVGETDLVEGVLDRGLLGLNRLLRGYRMVDRRAPDVRPVAVEDLDPLLAWRAKATADTGWGPVSVVPVNVNFPVFPDTLPYADLRKVDTATEMFGRGHPFVLHRDWLETAKLQHSQRGDPTASLVSLQTAAETLLFAVTLMTAVDDGATSAQVRALVETEVPYKSLLTRVLPGRIGGDWSLDRGPVGAYWTDLYLVRNRAVHGGVPVTTDAMEAAWRAWTAFNGFLVDRLHTEWRRHPRTLVAYLGKPGLERRGWLTQPMRATLDGLEAEKAPFWLPADVRSRAGPADDDTDRDV